MIEATKVTVTVTYEMEYYGKVSEDDIDINDVIRDTDSIKDIKVKTKSVSDKVGSNFVCRCGEIGWVNCCGRGMAGKVRI